MFYVHGQTRKSKSFHFVNIFFFFTINEFNCKQWIFFVFIDLPMHKKNDFLPSTYLIFDSYLICAAERLEREQKVSGIASKNHWRWNEIGKSFMGFGFKPFLRPISLHTFRSQENWMILVRLQMTASVHAIILRIRNGDRFS